MPILLFLLFLLGLLLTVRGGDAFVEAAAWLAEASGIPKFIVGATIVSVATTLPEILVSVIAALNGQTDMAAGNAVGSVSCNTALILGLLCLCRPVTFRRAAFGIKSLLMLCAALVLTLFSRSGQLDMLPGILLLTLFFLFLLENLFTAQNSCTPAAEREVQSVPTQLIRFALGIAAIILGARLIVRSGTALAEQLGIPESIVSVTLIAAGTSLPELATAISAIRKGQVLLSVGNIIGANIIDLTLILPLCSFLSGKPLPVGAQCMHLDLPFCMLSGCIALLPALIAQCLRRWQGIVLILLYAAYIAAII